MKKQYILIYPLLLMGVFLVIAGSCKKDKNKDIPVLSTAAVTDITQTTAISGGNITSDAGATVTARGVCWSTGQTPTISDNITTDGVGAGSFSSNVSGLTPNTTYYLRAYATNGNGTGYGSTMSFTTEVAGDPNSFTDARDGNVYKKVTIGSQVWMAQNLKYLPGVSGSGIGSLVIPYYYVYGYNGTSVTDAKATANYVTYGVLYNWAAAMNGASSSTSNPSGVQGICPQGWHLPSDAEWTQLTDYLGGASVAGGKLKETGTSHWNSPNTGATNESGFTALPGGALYNNAFTSLGTYGYWWSATENSANSARMFSVGFNSSYTSTLGYGKDEGLCVRCVKD